MTATRPSGPACCTRRRAPAACAPTSTSTCCASWSSAPPTGSPCGTRPAGSRTPEEIGDAFSSSSPTESSTTRIARAASGGGTELAGAEPRGRCGTGLERRSGLGRGPERAEPTGDASGGSACLEVACFSSPPAARSPPGVTAQARLTGADLYGTVSDESGAALPGRHGHGHERRDQPDPHRHHRRPRAVPGGRAPAGQLSHHGGGQRLRRRAPRGGGAPLGQAARHRLPAHAGRHQGGDHGDGRGAPGRPHPHRGLVGGGPGSRSRTCPSTSATS